MLLFDINYCKVKCRMMELFLEFMSKISAVHEHIERAYVSQMISTKRTPPNTLLVCTLLRRDKKRIQSVCVVKVQTSRLLV